MRDHVLPAATPSPAPNSSRREHCRKTAPWQPPIRRGARVSQRNSAGKPNWWCVRRVYGQLSKEEPERRGRGEEIGRGGIGRYRELVADQFSVEIVNGIHRDGLALEINGYLF